MNTYYFNAEFDLTLRGNPSLLAKPGDSFLHELSLHYLFAGCEGDFVLMHYPLPINFLDYLHNKNVPVPSPLLYPEIKPETIFKPFGWNEHTLALNQQFKTPTLCPAEAIIKRVNSRTFSYELETHVFGESDKGLIGGGIFTSVQSLTTHLQNHANSDQGWVFKANHGNAGAGHRYLKSSDYTEIDQGVAEKFIRENGSVVLEPMHNRVHDFGCYFELTSNGEYSIPTFHHLFNSMQGVFLGVGIEPSFEFLGEWKKPLLEAADKIAQALHREGYFGPVNFDSYLWKDRDTLRLRPLVDLNARYSMAFPCHQIATWLPNKFLLWQFPTTASLPLPLDYTQWDIALSDLAYNSKTQKGVLLTSPLCYLKNNQWVKPKRLGWLLVADSADELVIMRQALSLVLGKS